MSLSSPNTRRARWVALTAAVCEVLFAAPTSAQTRITLDADAKIVLSDNPFLLSGKDTASGAVELVARPEFILPVASGTSIELSAILAHRQYFRRYGGFLTGTSQVLVTHRDSEYLSVEGRLVAARTLPSDALTDSIDFAVDPGRVRESVTSRLSLDWKPGVHDTISARAGLERLRYPGSQLLDPTTALSAGIGWTRRLDEKVSLGVLASLVSVAGVGPDRLVNHAVYGTLAYRLGHAWNADAQLGVEWTSAAATGGSQSPRLSGSGSLCYRPPRLDACFSASLRSEVSGVGGLQRERFLGVTLRRQTSSRGSLAAGIEYRSAELGPFAGATDALRISASYEQRMTRSVAIMSSVDFLRRQFLTGTRNRALVLQIGIVLRRRGS